MESLTLKGRGQSMDELKGYKEFAGSLQLKEPRTEAEQQDNPNEIKVIMRRDNEYPDGTPWESKADEG